MAPKSNGSSSTDGGGQKKNARSIAFAFNCFWAADFTSAHRAGKKLRLPVPDTDMEVVMAKLDEYVAKHGSAFALGFAKYDTMDKKTLACDGPSLVRFPNLHA